MNLNASALFAPLLVLGAAVSGPVLAQAAHPEIAIELAQAMSGDWGPLSLGHDSLLFAAGEMGQERVVKGAPYCADALHETVQWLPDGSGGAGNRIVRRQSTRLCRDGEGRTRQETERDGRRLVYLRDPLSRENWVLDVERKTARRLGGSMQLPDSAAWRDYAERMRAWARDFSRSFGGQPGAHPPAPPTPPVPPAAPVPPAPVAMSRHDGGSREVELRVLRLDPAAAGGMAFPAPPSVSWRAQSLAPRGPGVDTPLGSKDIEGQRANGERTTWTIEAGKVGNEKPIQIVREVWTSPELMLTLSSRDFDPRSGEVNYRLQNLRRGEPDAALMKVPADYSQPRGPASPKAPTSAPRG